MTESVTTQDNDANGEGAPENMDEREPSKAAQLKGLGRKEKRKALKKEKRKQIRKYVAEKARSEEEARLNDPEEQRRIQLEEEQEKERLERERREYVERERIFLEELERKRKEEEEEERRNAVEGESRQNQAGEEQDSDEDDKWEYVEEGLPEIIWQGNEIIVKKNKVRVKKKDAILHIEKEDPNRPTSNPLPPQSEAYAAYKNESMTSAQLLDSVAQQIPNFGTEQDKAHCPFHIKTGACRFGSRCNRIHYYPDKSCTLLIKNMYNGPGLAWEQDEGLEYTDEEVEHNYEEFYNDVHNEFSKFGEIINFKVCRNGSFHLRGNVYVHYKSMDSAVMAYNSQHGRYYAGKQVKCEFVNLTKWKVAICGEYMKSRLKMCSRGTACNFLHCFSNPGREYEWADCDKPPPRYWVQKMIALFGHLDESWCDKQIERPSPRDRLNSSRILTSDGDSYYRKRNQSMETDRYSRSSSRSYYEEDDMRKRRHHERRRSNSRKQTEPVDEKNYDEEKGYKHNHHHNSTIDDTDYDGNLLDRERDRDVRRTRYRGSSRSSSRHEREESKSRGDHGSRKRFHFTSSDEDLFKSEKHMERHHGHARKRSRHEKNVSELSGSDGESNDTKLEQQRRHSSSEPCEVDFSGHKEKNRNSSRHHRRNSTHSRSGRHDSDEGVGEVCYRESENELFPNKQERYKRKSTVDKNAGSHSSHRYSRSRSQDSGYFSDKHNDESDRWEPDESTHERHHGRSSSTVSGEDHQQVGVGSQSYDQTSDDAFTTRNTKHGNRSSSRARQSGSLEDESSRAEEFKNLEESSGNSHHEKMRNHKAREKRKRV